MNNRAIIDPPVGPFSSSEEITDWLKELDALEPSQEREDAIAQAEQWLRWASERESE